MRRRRVVLSWSDGGHGSVRLGQVHNRLGTFTQIRLRAFLTQGPKLNQQLMIA
jgi:hypothetical protein